MTTEAMKKRVGKVIGMAGGHARVSDQLGISLQAVSNWKSRGRIPVRHYPALKRLSRGRVRAEHLL